MIPTDQAGVLFSTASLGMSTLASDLLTFRGTANQAFPDVIFANLAPNGKVYMAHMIILSVSLLL